MLNIKKTAIATTILGMALSATLLVGCGGGTSANSGKPAQTQTPAPHGQATAPSQNTPGKQPATATGTSSSGGQSATTGGGNGKGQGAGGQGAAPHAANPGTAPAQQPTCTVKVAGHCVIVDPTSSSTNAGKPGNTAPQVAQAPGSGTHAQPSATAAPAQPTGTQYTPPSRPHASATAPAQNGGGNSKSFGSN